MTLFAHREIARHDMASFRTGLVERAQYREMFLTGKAPTLAEPKGKAAREIDALVVEIEAIVGPAGRDDGEGGMSRSPTSSAPSRSMPSINKLAETARRKRIPSLTVATDVEPEAKRDTAMEEAAPAVRAADDGPSEGLSSPEPTHRPGVEVAARVRRRPLSIEVPEYLARELRVKAATDAVTVRFLVLSALVEAGYRVDVSELEEDGRRLR